MVVCIGLHSKVRNTEVMEDYDSRRRSIKKAWAWTEVPVSKTASESTPAPSSSERRVAIDDEYPNDEEDVLNALEEDRQYFEEVERLREKVEEIESCVRIKFPREHEQAKVIKGFSPADAVTQFQNSNLDLRTGLE